MQGGHGELIHITVETEQKEETAGRSRKTREPAVVKAREPEGLAEPARVDTQPAIRRVKAAGKE